MDETKFTTFTTLSGKAFLIIVEIRQNPGRHLFSLSHSVLIYS